MSIPTALILEGMPDGTSRLDDFADSGILQIARIAPGCLCCTGNLTMRVTLNRMLRHPPQRLFISLATDAHLDRIHDYLTRTPYDILLEITKDLQV